MNGTALRGHLPATRDATQPLPCNPADYRYVLIAEIAKVMKDHMEDTNKCYSFAEWSWYLKLIGEDESSPETHRTHPHNQQQAPCQGPSAGQAVEAAEKWSWVGIRSPLVSSTGECEWILKRLTAKLHEELGAAAAREQGTVSGEGCSHLADFRCPVILDTNVVLETGGYRRGCGSDASKPKNVVD